MSAASDEIHRGERRSASVCSAGASHWSTCWRRAGSLLKRQPHQRGANVFGATSRWPGRVLQAPYKRDPEGSRALITSAPSHGDAAPHNTPEVWTAFESPSQTVATLFRHIVRIHKDFVTTPECLLTPLQGTRAFPCLLFDLGHNPFIEFVALFELSRGCLFEQGRLLFK